MAATETVLRESTVAAPASNAPSTKPRRYLALDAYGVFIVVILCSGGFAFAALAKINPSFAPIASQFEHHDWTWIAFWDLIQPAFMFMVGVAMPFALAMRMTRGMTER